ncbi:MAG: hypothetical protein HOJ90_04925 [Alphaproteobacteria bacterium]|nr:hypothetical protein [Alphaproteobacteria bacterium]
MATTKAAFVWQGDLYLANAVLFLVKDHSIIKVSNIFPRDVDGPVRPAGRYGGPCPRAPEEVSG